MEKGRVSYCRLCGELKALSALVDVGSNTQDIINKLNRINVTADLKTAKLPKTVCQKCMIQLYEAHLFVQTIERGQRAIAAIIQQINQEVIGEITDPLNVHTQKQGSEQDHSELNIKEVKVEFENEDDASSNLFRNVLSLEGDIPQEKKSHSPLEKGLRGNHIMTLMKTESEQDQIELDNEENYILPDNNFQSLLEKSQRFNIGKPVMTVPVEYNEYKTTDNNEIENKEDINEKVILSSTQVLASTSSLEKTLEGVVSVKSVAVILQEETAEDKTTTDKSKISEVSSPFFYNTVPTWKDYIWQCSICDTQYPTHDEFKNHSMEVHRICNILRCYDCKAIRSNLPMFIKHVREEHRNHLKHSCYKCHKVIESPHEAGQHRLIHQPTKHICNGCHSTFNTPQELQDHFSTYYRDINLKYTFNINDTTCKECGKTLTTPSRLMSHLKLHTERKRDHRCVVCGKCFYNKQTLKGHMVIHNDERPFQCDLCKLKFKSNQYLRRHVKMHIAEQQYTCDHCGRSFKLKSRLSSHIIVHSGLLPFACGYCDKAFRSRNNLNQHMRQHTGVKPFSCTVCHRDFTFRGNYHKHMKRRHNMDMRKEKRIDNETDNSESVKKYVNSVLKNVKQKKSRPRFIKLE